MMQSANICMETSDPEERKQSETAKAKSEA